MQHTELQNLQKLSIHQGKLPFYHLTVDLDIAFLQDISTSVLW